MANLNYESWFGRGPLLRLTVSAVAVLTACSREDPSESDSVGPTKGVVVATATDSDYMVRAYVNRRGDPGPDLARYDVWLLSNVEPHTHERIFSILEADPVRIVWRQGEIEGLDICYAKGHIVKFRSTTVSGHRIMTTHLLRRGRVEVCPGPINPIE